MGLLERIVVAKRDEVVARMRTVPLETFRDALVPSPRSLSFSGPRPFIIGELKVSSPSTGSLCSSDELMQLIPLYNDYCAGISVVTDTRYFGGSLDLLRAIRKQTTLPVLRKDFIIDPYQIYESRFHGADMILLIASVLSDAQLRDYSFLAAQYAMQRLVEVHTEHELEHALALPDVFIGINNRDLDKQCIDFSVTERLAPSIPVGRVVVSESGIQSYADIKKLPPRIDGVLIGTSILQAPDTASFLASLRGG